MLDCDRSCQRKVTSCDHIGSKRNKLNHNISTCITSYLNLKLLASPLGTNLLKTKHFMHDHDRHVYERLDIDVLNQLEGLVTKQNWPMFKNASAFNYSKIPFIFWIVMTFERTLWQEESIRVAGLVTGNKIDVSALSDTTVSVLILFLLLVDLINCKGGHPWRVLLPRKLRVKDQKRTLES